jgi:hypothetical protein
MVALPRATPVTSPVASTDAIEALLVPHVPPVSASVSADVVPGQTVVVPEIVPAPGSGFTVIEEVAEAEPQLFVTV